MIRIRRAVSCAFFFLIPGWAACQAVNPTGVSGVSYRDDEENGPEQTQEKEQAEGDSSLGGSPPAEESESNLPPCSADAEQIMARVNLYRQNSGKVAIAYSPSLCFVAESHVEDLISAKPYTEPGCSPNSWSSDSAAMPCCYAPDESNPECMWEKPGELTDYAALGYESVAINVASPADAFLLWKEQPGHNALMLNQEQWQSPWLAMGAAFVDGHAVIWFGEEEDPFLE